MHEKFGGPCPMNVVLFFCADIAHLEFDIGACPGIMGLQVGFHKGFIKALLVEWTCTRLQVGLHKGFINCQARVHKAPCRAS